jgi:hypothetical protein
MRVQSGWLTAVCLLFIPGSALAQPVTGSIDQVWARLKRAEPLIITDASGRELRGTILDRSPELLVLQQNGHLLNIPIKDIRKIEHRKGISGPNGAAIGAAVGAGIAVLMAESTGALQHEDGYMSYFVGVPLMTAIGAVAGAGLAAVTNHQEVLFRRAIPVAKVTVSPVFAREHRVTLSLHPTVDRNRRALLFTARW